MIKLTTIAALATLATSSAVFAEDHATTAKDRAQSMKSVLAGNGKNGGVGGFGLPGASVASTLRPGGDNGEALGTGGWGNIGSSLITSDGTPVSPANPKNVGE